MDSLAYTGEKVLSRAYDLLTSGFPLWNLSAPWKVTASRDEVDGKKIWEMAYDSLAQLSCGSTKWLLGQGKPEVRRENEIFTSTRDHYALDLLLLSVNSFDFPEERLQQAAERCSFFRQSLAVALRQGPLMFPDTSLGRSMAKALKESVQQHVHIEPHQPTQYREELVGDIVTVVRSILER